MTTRIGRALELWPETKSDDWSMRGSAVVHKDATVNVADENLRGGFIRSGMVFGDARVCGNAQVYGNAWVYGDAWESSPPLAQGSRHCANACSSTNIAIGCEVHEVAWWREHYKAVGEANGYTPEQVEEYGRIIEFIAGELERRFPQGGPQ